MSNLAVFERAVSETNDWLDEIMALMDWSDRKLAYKAVRVVLQTVRDRLTIEEATDLGAQLPLLLKGTYYESWNPTGKPTSLSKVDDFVAIVNKNFTQDDYIAPEDISRAVLKVLASRVSEGEIDDVISSMPKELKTLWT
jgi:uncharacterized protein (DUF2267 family)